MADDVVRCRKCSRAMDLASRFRFDHEAGDSPRDTAALERFRALGLELGAEVSVWRCTPCDVVEATFTYPPKEDTRP